jgi:hypothetical protein
MDESSPAAKAISGGLAPYQPAYTMPPARIKGSMPAATDAQPIGYGATVMVALVAIFVKRLSAKKRTL